MENLELKHLAPYMPYGLNCKIYQNNKPVMNMFFDEKLQKTICLEIHKINGAVKSYNYKYECEELTVWSSNGSGYTNRYLSDRTDYPFEIKPILRPLSDISKEIEHNGVKFVPLLKILEMQGYVNTLITNIERTFIYFSGDYPTGCCPTDPDYERENDRISFYDFSEKFISLKNAQKLYEWHFDVSGLIEKGLAININTLQNE